MPRIYPSGPFNVKVADVQELANSFQRLDDVAPVDIEPSAHSSMQQIYQKLVSDPSQLLQVSVSAGLLDDNL